MVNQKYSNYNQLSFYLAKEGISDNTYIRWVKDIVNTKMGLFTYKKLPNELTTRIVENALLFNNYLCWYNDNNLGGLVLCKWVPSTTFNMYKIPNNVDLYSLSGELIKSNVPWGAIIPCRDNAMDIIPFTTLQGWLDKIIEVEKTIDINLRIARFPLILKGSKQETTQLKQLIKKMYQCEGIVIGSSDLTGRLESNNINLPVSIDTLYTLLTNYKNQALSSMGVYSAYNKKERLINEEMTSQQEYVDIVYTEMLNERKQWLKAIKDKWGYDIELVETYDINFINDLENKIEEAKALEGASNE